MKCQICNYENSGTAAYCKNCGASLKSHKTCKSGHNYDASLEHCPYCPRPETLGGIKTQIDSEPPAMDKTVVDMSSSRLSNQASYPAGASDKTVIYGSGQKETPQAEPRKLVGWLVTFDIDPAGTDFRLTVGRHKIGRGAENEIVINQPGVSELHATLLYRAGKFLLQDNLSVNGTFVNGDMIADKTELNNGDVIRMGRIDLRLITV